METKEREIMMEMKKERDRDFIKAVEREMRNPHLRGRGMREIVKAAANGPAPSYYLTYDRVMKMLPGRESEAIPVGARSARGAMWREIHRRVLRRMRRSGVRRSDAVSMVLAEGNASSFFLTESSAWVLYHRLLRKAS